MKKLLSIILMLFASPAIADMQPVSQHYLFNLTYEDAEDAIGNALAQKGLGAIVSATINMRKSAPLFSYNKPITVEIRGLQAQSDMRRWSANLLVLADGAVISAMPLAGRYTEMLEVPVLRRQVRAGEVIVQENIEIRRFPMDRTASDVISDMTSLVGKTPVRVISPARPIRNLEIASPAEVKKNTLVQMRYKSGGMEITTSGQALNDGARGQMIQVRNTMSKKIVNAVVADERTVDVMAQGVQQTAQLTTGVDYHANY